MTIELKVNRAEVLNEVAMTASYTGAKKTEEGAYQRIMTTDADNEQLERYWQEAVACMSEGLMRLIEQEEMDGEELKVGIRVSESFEPTLKSGMEKALRSYFVLTILSRWFVVANKEEAAEYATQAGAMLEDVKRKAFYKGRPTIPTRYRRR